MRRPPITPKFTKLNQHACSSLGVNRLSGPIPKELGNMTALTSLVLQSNQLSGELPRELGNLTKLERLFLSSNNFTGKLPEELGRLSNMKDFIISDISGPESAIPDLSNMGSIRALILRNCNLVGAIPSYIGEMQELDLLDLSFNKLEGRIPATFVGLPKLVFLFLPKKATYMTFLTITLQQEALHCKTVKKGKCKELVCKLFYREKNVEMEILHAQKRSSIVQPLSMADHYSSHINCGGDKVTINKNTTYEADRLSSGAANFASSDGWAISSTGNFVNDNKPIDSYIAYNKSTLFMPNSELYSTARLSPLSLTYYGLCLLNGNYTLKLHFAEIILTDDRTYSSLGRRIFDVYIQVKVHNGIEIVSCFYMGFKGDQISSIQGELALKDFNIINEAGGSGREVVKPFFSIPVANHTLEIRFIWAGRGTQIVPEQGTYGPLISAISLESGIMHRWH
ncbi:hypothetical protein ACLOJK_008666 [Asimina triloba]